MPVLDALKTYPKEIALAAGSFVATHAHDQARLRSHHDSQRQHGFEPVRHPDDPGLRSALGLYRPPQAVPDRHGRARTFCNPLRHAGVDLQLWLFLLGGLIVQACLSAVYGPQSAYFAEQFSTRMRYSGGSLAFQFAAIFGGMAPLICTALVAITGSVYSIAAFVIVLAMVSFACSYLMTETSTHRTTQR